MINLTIRNIPDELLKRIRLLARRERRSMNGQILMVLEKGMRSDTAGGISSGEFAGEIAGELRVRLWEELCGEWRDSTAVSDRLTEIYQLRDR